MNSAAAVRTDSEHPASAIGSSPGHDLAAISLDERGMIRDCNRASEALFNYRRSELVWRHVSLLLPQLAQLDLMQGGQPNPRLRFLCHAGHHFQGVTRSGERFASKLFLNLLNSSKNGGLSLIVRPAE